MKKYKKNKRKTKAGFPATYITVVGIGGEIYQLPYIRGYTDICNYTADVRLFCCSKTRLLS